MAAPRRRLFSSAVAASLLLDAMEENGDSSNSDPLSQSLSEPEDPDFIIPPSPHEEQETVTYTQLTCQNANSTCRNNTVKGDDDDERPVDCISDEPLRTIDLNTMEQNENLANSVEENATDLTPVDCISDEPLRTIDLNTMEQNENLANSVEENATDLTPVGCISDEPLRTIDLNTMEQNENLANSVEENATDLTPTMTRKRKRDPTQWKRNVSKTKRQAGQEYQSLKTKEIIPEKKVKTVKNCSNCKFKCNEKISEEERKNINKMFWSLNDETKAHFYSEYTIRCEKARCRAVTNEKPKVFSYKYFLRCGGTSLKVQVCKTFFLSTLDISQIRISYFYEKRRCVETGVPLPPKSGKNVKNKISDECLDVVRSHINSFPRIPSHYCRADSCREYLEKSLNLSKMYGMYQDLCVEKEIEPVKKHKYDEIFNKEFNISFLAPKKDRCDKCELVLKDSKNLNQEELAASTSKGEVILRLLEKNMRLGDKEKEQLVQHVENYRSTKHERERDRNSKEKAVICFDLENVFPLPVCGISNFFYKRKLVSFNMTATLSLSKKAYFAVWHEGSGGRAANNMASAIVKILEEVLKDHPLLSDITLWSDSCVCQNRNSVMSTALSLFIKKKKNIDIITQKFCESGHSSIQEVDNVHSVIERHLRHQEIFSHIGLIKKLKTIKNSQVIQMRDFLDFQSYAQQEFVFSRVPFTKIRQLQLCQSLGTVSYKTCHQSPEWTTVSVRRDPYTLSTRKRGCSNHNRASEKHGRKLNVLNKNRLPDDKKKDLLSMLPYFPELDKVFVETVLK